MTTLATAAAIAAVAAVATVAAIAATAIALVASGGLFLTAQESDADDREKDRDPENNQSIHSKSSKRKRVRNSRRYVQTPSPSMVVGSWRDGEPPETDILACVSALRCFVFLSAPCLKVCGLQRLHKRRRVGC
jgi:hypothetical protein